MVKLNLIIQLLYFKWFVESWHITGAVTHKLIGALLKM